MPESEVTSEQESSAKDGNLFSAERNQLKVETEQMGVAVGGTVYAGFEFELVERNARWDACKSPIDSIA